MQTYKRLDSKAMIKKKFEILHSMLALTKSLNSKAKFHIMYIFTLMLVVACGLFPYFHKHRFAN